jgi:hypothetical protein
MGLALVSQGQFDNAIIHFRKAVNLKTDFVAAQNNLIKAQNDMKHIDSIQQQH